jgi:formylmethanofuran dehydrogenase subunit E
MRSVRLINGYFKLYDKEVIGVQEQKQNQQRQQTGQVKCDHCGQLFDSQEELRGHQQICTGQSKPHP